MADDEARQCSKCGHRPAGDGGVLCEQCKEALSVPASVLYAQLGLPPA
ncbi:hypothetical protein ABZU76_06470 [Amycolatopsis sp. NPDC005232]